MADPGASKLSESNNVLGPHDPTCCGVVEHAAVAAREKRSSRTTKQPWIVRKLMIFVTLGILGYASYVYIGRLCLPMIQKHSGAPAGRGTGIALLVVYAILLLWAVWAYLKVILTPPGFAKDYIPKSAKPFLPPANSLRISWQSGTPDMELGIGEPTQTLSRHQTQPSLSRVNQSHYPIDGIGGPSYEDMLMSPRKSGSVRYSSGEMDNGARLPMPVVKQEEGTEKEAESQSAVGVGDVTPGTSLNGEATLARNSVGEPQSKDIGRKASRSSRKKQSTHITRWPPTTAVLLPAHRYCSWDEIVKPYRAHHCRACGTCVLKYDHHCPWIGQCVGARNHKFFLNFCQAVFVFSAFVFATLIVYTVRMMNVSSSDLDPQMIVIIALAGLFALFTFTLVVTHVRLILNSQTTVESMSIRSMEERESATLQRAYSWWEFGARRRTLKEWDHEWGALSTEGNIWWMGGRGGEWFSVMGSNAIGWVFPIGRSSDDGLSYPVNPRFDEDGRWRRRDEWPEALR